ncbi:MAG TPA: tRNA guanosine(34) transglycosylase Tgt [Rhizomicrobium sp.]|nr:tRNA guanosine(34) transglycosylase Tgt [Rhizomicrobium sp.]
MGTLFELECVDARTKARVGRLITAHGGTETPCFLPIASHGTLRALSFEQAAECGTSVIMANAWYLFNNTTNQKLLESGGVRRQMGWGGILFTDSGGYQVFSLKDTCQITDDGLSFDRGRNTLTPELVVEIQKYLGSDIMMILDDCAGYPSNRERVLEAVRRTTLWAKRSLTAHRKLHGFHGHDQYVYGIVQGGTHKDLRRRSCNELAALGFDGFGIGGLSIGMPRNAVREMTFLSSELLPWDKPRHLLGVGLPNQILEGIADGADTFDCVLPIRKAQRGVAYTRSGALYYKRPHLPHLQDEPLDPTCTCGTCRTWSRERLRLLFKEDKVTAGTLASMHNLHFYHQVLAGAREAIRENRFAIYKEDFISEWGLGELDEVS